MTKEEAINKWVIPAIRSTWKEEKCEEIIEALKQAPCDDCISRQAVLDLVDADWKYEGLALPIENLPPVTPQLKKGHWYKKELPNGRWICSCSECDYNGRFEWIACPNCKAEMQEVEE